jgi:hypothetical protein
MTLLRACISANNSLPANHTSPYARKPTPTYLTCTAETTHTTCNPSTLPHLMIEANDGSERAWPQGHSQATPKCPKAAKGHVCPPVFTLQSYVKQSYSLSAPPEDVAGFNFPISAPESWRSCAPRIVEYYQSVAGSTTNQTYCRARAAGV